MTSDRLPFTVLLPTDGAIIDVLDQVTTLRLGVVNVESVPDLDDSWAAPGVYALLGRPRANGTYHVYVGKTSSLRQRLGAHAQTRSFYRALLIRRSSEMALHTTQVGWLEGDLHEMFRFARSAVVDNKQVPHDTTIHDYEIPLLARLRDPVARVLGLIGHDITVGPKPVNPSDPSQTTVLDLVLAGRIPAGCPLTPAPSRARSVTGVVTAQGWLEVGDRLFHFPTQAARSVLASVGLESDEPSGWRFWTVPGDRGPVSLAAIRDDYVQGRVSVPVAWPVSAQSTRHESDL